MLEAYLFHAMFALQILFGSILIPQRLVLRGREMLSRSATPLPPGGEQHVEGIIRQYRIANGVVVIIGLLLWGFLASYMHEPDWSDGPVEVWLGPYLVLQCVPLFLVSLRVTKLGKELGKSLAGQRKKALLQRRGLFDFVSPLVVGLALLCYPLFIAMVLYIERDPFAGFAGAYINIVLVTLQYCFTGAAIYFVIYGRKRHTSQTHDARMRQMETLVTLAVYSCLVAVLGLMINFSLVLLDRQRLEPFAQSASFVLIALWIYWKIHPAQPESASRYNPVP